MGIDSIDQYGLRPQSVDDVKDLDLEGPGNESITDMTSAEFGTERQRFVTRLLNGEDINTEDEQALKRNLFGYSLLYTGFSEDSPIIDEVHSVRNSRTGAFMSGLISANNTGIYSLNVSLERNCDISDVNDGFSSFLGCIVGYMLKKKQSSMYDQEKVVEGIVSYFEANTSRRNSMYFGNFRDYAEFIVIRLNQTFFESNVHINFRRMISKRDMNFDALDLNCTKVMMTDSAELLEKLNPLIGEFGQITDARYWKKGRVEEESYSERPVVPTLDYAPRPVSRDDDSLEEITDAEVDAVMAGFHADLGGAGFSDEEETFEKDTDDLSLSRDEVLAIFRGASHLEADQDGVWEEIDIERTEEIRIEPSGEAKSDGEPMSFDTAYELENILADYVFGPEDQPAEDSALSSEPSDEDLSLTEQDKDTVTEGVADDGEQVDFVLPPEDIIPEVETVELSGEPKDGQGMFVTSNDRPVPTRDQLKKWGFLEEEGPHQKSTLWDSLRRNALAILVVGTTILAAIAAWFGFSNKQTQEIIDSNRPSIAKKGDDLKDEDYKGGEPIKFVSAKSALVPEPLTFEEVAEPDREFPEEAVVQGVNTKIDVATAVSLEDGEDNKSGANSLGFVVDTRVGTGEVAGDEITGEEEYDNGSAEGEVNYRDSVPGFVRIPNRQSAIRHITKKLGVRPADLSLAYTRSVIHGNEFGFKRGSRFGLFVGHLSSLDGNNFDGGVFKEGKLKLDLGTLHFLAEVSGMTPDQVKEILISA